jgi:TetR/AcrR family acrAB operon transcriptional repressor
MRDGLTKIEGGLRNAVSKGQVPADLDTKLAAAMVHSFVSGSLRDMLFLPDATDFGAHAQQLVDALFDALRLSPALRKRNP